MRRLLCLLLAASLGSAQSPRSPRSSAVAILEASLKSDFPSGVLVVMDGPTRDSKQTRKALGEDLEWENLEIFLWVLSPKDVDAVQWLGQKAAAGPPPIWMLFKPGGDVAASGGALPDAKAMVNIARTAGMKSFTQTLRDFIYANPDHMDARRDLLFRLSQKASRRTRIHLGIKDEPVQASDEPFDYVKAQLRRDAAMEEKARAEERNKNKPPIYLPPEVDQALWGEFAEGLKAAFREGSWWEIWSHGIYFQDEVSHSSIMVEAARVCIPEVERALGRAPSRYDLWQTWVSLARAMGGRPIRPLLDSLRAVPGHDINRELPEEVRSAYVKDARQQGDWPAIRDFLLPIAQDRLEWERSPNRVSFQLMKDGKIQPQVETGEYWRNMLEPLVEALLMLGETGTADEWVMGRWADHPWLGLPQRAAALAMRCGQPGLASKWGALGRN